MTGVGIWLRARLGLLLVPLAGAFGSCGGTARSTRHDESAGGAAASSGGSGTAGASAAGGMGRAGTAASSAGTPGASMGGATATNTGGVADGGAADGGSTAGAGGEGETNCVDVCALHGPTCCVPACVSADARCVIDVFDTMLSSGIYGYADLDQTVASLSQSFSASVSTADIEWAGADPSAAARIEMRLSPAASELYGTALEGAEMHAFRLSCDGEELFVGQVYMQNGAAALDTPVLHVARDVDGAVILRLGAQQGAWGLSAQTPLAARERLDRPQLRATLCLAGALPAL